MTTSVTLQEISGLLDQRFMEFEQKLDQKLEAKFEEKFEEKLAPIYKELKKHSKQLTSLKKDQDLILITLDREQVHQWKRLNRVEDHLGLSSLVD